MAGQPSPSVRGCLWMLETSGRVRPLCFPPQPQPPQLLPYREGTGLYWGNGLPSRSAGTSIPVGATGLSRELSRQMVPLSRQSCSRAGILHRRPDSPGWLLRELASQPGIPGLEIPAPRPGTAP